MQELQRWIAITAESSGKLHALRNPAGTTTGNCGTRAHDCEQSAGSSLPLVAEPFDRGLVLGKRKRAGAHRRVFGKRDRVLGPSAVDHGTGQQHDLTYAGTSRSIERELRGAGVMTSCINELVAPIGRGQVDQNVGSLEDLVEIQRTKITQVVSCESFGGCANPVNANDRKII